MPNVTFEVETYQLTISRELTGTASGLSVKFPAYIFLTGDEYSAVVYCLDDTSPVPPNTFSPTNKRGTIYVPRWQFEWFRDLVRNETPVYCTLSSDTPKWHSLSTGPEPVGEFEV